MAQFAEVRIESLEKFRFSFYPNCRALLSCSSRIFGSRGFEQVWPFLLQQQPLRMHSFSSMPLQPHACETVLRKSANIAGFATSDWTIIFPPKYLDTIPRPMMRFVAVTRMKKGLFRLNDFSLIHIA